MKLWFRTIFFSLVKTFFFLLTLFFTLYVIVDLSIHGIRFFNVEETDFLRVAFHYLYSFSALFLLFGSVAFLFASLKVLFDLHRHLELVALQMAGLSKKVLLKPFFLFAACLTLFFLANSEWIAPNAQEEMGSFRAASKMKKKKIVREHVHTLTLEDDTQLVYQSFDESEKKLFDVYWIKNPKNIWHMKYLDIKGPEPIGLFVDHFLRNEKRQLEKKESYDALLFTKMEVDASQTFQQFVPFENRSISTLISEAFSKSPDRASILTHLHYRTALPLLPFLILLALSPVALRFGRTKAYFLITALFVFVFLGLMTVLEGMVILGENQVLSPFMAIWGPLLLIFAPTIHRFAKMQ